MGGGESIADQILKSFRLPDMVGSKTSSKKLINLLRGYVHFSICARPSPSFVFMSFTVGQYAANSTSWPRE